MPCQLYKNPILSHLLFSLSQRVATVDIYTTKILLAYDLDLLNDSSTHSLLPTLALLQSHHLQVNMWTKSDVLQLLQLLAMVILALIQAVWCLLILQGEISLTEYTCPNVPNS